MAMIEAKKLTKTFGHIEAVKQVSFSVEKGEVLGFLGPNGAGKSTVMRMLTCFLTPTAGTATVGGYDILGASLDVRRITGYMPESNPVYEDMTALSFLRFVAEMRGYRGAELRKRVNAVIESCWLEGVRQQPLSTLSKGFKRRVGLAQSLIHDPAILILDEPTDGLDPNQKHEVRTLIAQMAAEKCIVISTHILEEVEAICTRAIIIANGELVADETPAALKKRSRYYGAVRLGLKTSDGAADVRAFEALPDARKVETEDSTDGLQRLTIFPKKGRRISDAVLDLVREKKWSLEEVTVEDGRLDEVFRDITRKSDKSKKGGGN